MTSAPDYYEILQVSAKADAEIIQAAYRRLAQKWHPDKNPGDPFAYERMKLLNEAYETLSDARSRREYDAGRGQAAASGRAKEEAPRAEPKAQEEPASATPPPPSASQRTSRDGWLKGLPDAPIIFIAGAILFLIGHGGILFGKSPAGPLAFLLSCFIWGVLFAAPAYFCYLNKQRTGVTVVAMLFMLAAGFNIALAVVIGYELELVAPRESPPPLPELSEPRDDRRDDPNSDMSQQFQAQYQGNLYNFVREQAARGRPWEEIVEEWKKKTKSRSLQVPQQYREPYERYLQYSRLPEAREKLARDGESLVAYLARRAIPVASAVGKWKRVGPYREAVKRFNDGKASKEDIELIARFEREQGIDPKPEKKSSDGAAK